jgi:hypothetical protein
MPKSSRPSRTSPTARTGAKAGYDGVEVMGSEGYLINQFIAAKTNNRTDEWGGSYENRIRFPLEIVRRTRERVGPNFIIIYRLSMLDLVENGSSFEEVVQLAKGIEAAGATIINTGIGWHEARIPTIATSVPRAAFAWVTQKLKGGVDSADHHQPHQHPGNRRGTAGRRLLPTWCRWRARSWPTRNSSTRPNRPRRRNQHLHRLQPGLSGPHLQEQSPPAWSTRAPATKPN